MSSLHRLTQLSRAGPEKPTGAPKTKAFSVPPPPSKWKTRILLPCVLFGAFAALGLVSFRHALFPAQGVQTVQVIARKSTGQGGGLAFQAAGWLEPDPYPIFVSALADGVVKEVHVLEDALVQPGDLLVSLVDEDARLALAEAKSELAMRQAELDWAQVRLRKAEDDWRYPTERTRAVATARETLANRQAALKKWSREVAVQQAEIAELEEELRREKVAVAGDALPEFDMIQTELSLETARARLEALRADEALLQADANGARAELEAAEEFLRLRLPEREALDAAKAQVAQAKANLDTARTRLETAELRLARMEIRAPVAGAVLRRLVNPGDKLFLQMDGMHSAHCFHLYDPEHLQVRVDVPLADAAGLKEGMQTHIVVDVLPNVTFQGQVTRITREADLQKNTLQVKVAIENPRPELKPEMLARVQFMEPKKEIKAGDQGFVVFAPETVLGGGGQGQGQATAWVLDKGAQAALQRSVTLGPGRHAGWREVTSGLQPGDILIAPPHDNLYPGKSVHVTGEFPVAAPVAPETSAPQKSSAQQPKGNSHGLH